MPVSVSITCKHLLIICEQMLAFGLVPSVIPSGGLCLATSLHRDVPVTFPLSDNSNSLHRKDTFVKHFKIRHQEGLIPFERVNILPRQDCSSMNTRKS